MTRPPQHACLRLSDDAERIGHAILALPEAREEAPALALRFADATFLGADGRRSRGRHFFATEALGPPPCRDIRLGPEITSQVREAELVSFVERDGRTLGTLVWEDIRVPPLHAAGARLGPGGVKPRKRIVDAAPVFVERPSGVRSGTTLAQAPAAPAVTDLLTAHSEAPPRKSVRWTVAAAGGLSLLVVLAWLVLILAGLAGWRLEPDAVRFAGQTGGAVTPASQKVRLVLAWYAKPLFITSLLPAPTLAADKVPPWLEMHPGPEKDGWTLSPARAAGALAVGLHQARLPLAFPLRRVDALMVSLEIAAADSALRPLPVDRQAAPPATFDDAACDRVAGNRFDGDHPSGAGFHDEIFDLTGEEVEKGLAACDPGGTRKGEGRRFGVQRGRLLAHRALLRLAAGDVALAGADMTAAVTLWRHGDEQGSAYAANLLGAYHDGVFNRGGHVFIVADDRIADEFWKRAMDAGNVVAERNYAAQLLAGKGVLADPVKAVGLLRDAIGKGDLHAGVILGVALVTGPPPGIPADRAEGWRLIVAAQCIDKGAATLLDQRIAIGEQPAASQRSCR